MYAILLTNKWTNSTRIYPLVYFSQQEADDNHAVIPYSDRNWSKQTIPLRLKTQ